MAKKKKEEAKQEVEHEPKKLFLTKEEMLNFDLHEARVECFKAKADAILVKRELFLKEVDPQGQYHKFGDALKQNNEKLTDLKNKHEALRKAIEARLGVSLKDYAYDDETGLLNFVADQ
jgi:hypothetical protein